MGRLCGDRRAAERRRRGGVDPGTAPSPSQSTAPAPTASAKPTLKPAEPSDEPSTAPPADATGSATAAPDAAAGDGKHRGEAAPEETEPDNADSDRETGRHASRGDGSARTEADKSDKVDSADAAPGEYTVLPGDSLSAIVDKEKLSGGWTALYEKNRETVGDNPDLILPGQSLDLGLNQE